MTLWMEIAKSYVGTKEIKGAEDNPVIVKFFEEAGHPEVKDDETAWCAAFIGACLYESGKVGNGSLWARDYLKWEGATPTTAPEYGDLVIWKRGLDAGHVAFFLSFTEDGHIRAIEGNGNDQVRETIRSADGLLGFRRIK